MLSENALPDLILSDIQLSDGTSFEIFEKMQLRCPIIFTTADYTLSIKCDLYSAQVMMNFINKSSWGHSFSIIANDYGLIKDDESS